MEITHSVQIKTKDIGVNASFRVESNRSCALKMQLASCSYIQCIFDYLEPAKRTSMQLLNKRFYNSFVPEWSAS